MANANRQPRRRRDAAEWLADARHCEREGDLFQAYDLAMRGLARYPGDLRLQHRVVVCLASTHATQQACDLFDRLELEPTETKLAPLPPGLRMDIATLKARLLKDAALAARGPEQHARFAESARAYEACYRRETAAENPEAYYPGVNAATVWLLAGERDTAKRIAAEVLRHLNSDGKASDYYRLVSAAEAHLVLGQVELAAELLRRARGEIVGSGDADFRALASTNRQLHLVVAANRVDPSVLSILAPPRVMHYCGHIIARPGEMGRFPAQEEDRVRREIDAKLAEADIGFAYGSLAAGADILFAEAILDRGGSLHVVLPFERREFVAESVARSGRGWVGRFNRCLAAATAVRYATHDRYLGDDQLYTYCSQLAMGLALLRARFLATEAEQVAVWDGRRAGGLAGSAIDIANWRHTGRTFTRIDSRGKRGGAATAPASATQRRTRAMLFGDMHGFSKLTDSQLPAFVELVLGTFARVIARYRTNDRRVFANTWGDGLFLVFDDAGNAASCALDLQDEIAALDFPSHGLPETLGLRLGGHLGPVYAARDPVLERDNFFGAHVSRAARIEPVTPERSVYVTETLAAVLVLHNGDEFECDYVGMTQAAKHYGRMRMFLLRRAATTSVPSGSDV